MVVKKVKAKQVLRSKPSQNYGVSPDQVSHDLLAARHKQAHPSLTPASKAGTRFTYP